MTLDGVRDKNLPQLKLLNPAISPVRSPVRQPAHMILSPKLGFQEWGSPQGCVDGGGPSPQNPKVSGTGCRDRFQAHAGEAR